MNRPEPVTVPCGRCIGCRLERSRQWAIRCICEAQMHDRNSFITLTYDDQHLVYGGAEHGILVPRHIELFWKRLRKRLGKFRYFACGEYGDKSNRPHYHACIFGLDFKDKKLWSSKDGVNLYTSDILNNEWKHGNCIIGDVTFESAAYVARYIMKKRLGKSASSYKEEGITPEFVRMSRRPGIGSAWFDKYSEDVYPHGVMTIKGGLRCQPPKYFDRKYQAYYPLEFDDIKLARFDLSRSKVADNTPARKAVRYRIKMRQISALIRSL